MDLWVLEEEEEKKEEEEEEEEEEEKDGNSTITSVDTLPPGDASYHSHSEDETATFLDEDDFPTAEELLEVFNEIDNLHDNEPPPDRLLQELQAPKIRVYTDKADDTRVVIF